MARFSKFAIEELVRAMDRPNQTADPPVPEGRGKLTPQHRPNGPPAFKCRGCNESWARTRRHDTPDGPMCPECYDPDEGDDGDGDEDEEGGD